MFNPPGFATSGGNTISTWPRVLVQIAWNAGGNTTAPNYWYTVSDRLRGNWKATLAGRQYEMDQIESGTFTFSLDNLDGAFDPDNTSSFFYPNVVPYRRCRLVFMTNPTQNIIYPWVANGTKTLSMHSTTGTIGTATGLTPSPSGLTTAQTWAIPNGSGSGVAFGLNGDAGADWNTTDNDGTTVIPGQPYSVGVDVSLASGGMTSLSLKARVAFYTLSGSLISRTLGTVQNVGTAWNRLTVSGTAPSNAAWAFASISTSQSATADTTVRTTAWQLEQAAAPTAYAYPGSWTQMWQGFVERWPQRYDKNGKYGLIDLTAIDALAPLSQLTFSNVMPTYVAQQSPEYMFDLAGVGSAPDSSTAKAFLDLNGTGVGMDIVGSAISTGVGISSAAPKGTLWNTPGPVITLSNNQASSLGNNSNASYLQPANSGGKIVALPSGAWTRMICFRTGAMPGTGGTNIQTTLWATTAPGFLSGTGDQSAVQLGIYNTGQMVAKVQNSSGVNQYFFNTAINVVDNNWHCAFLSLSADGKTATLAIDQWYTSVTSSVSLASSTYTIDAVGTTLTTNGSGENTQPFNGDIAWFAQWNSELSPSTMSDIGSGFAHGWSGDTNGNRLNRVMTLANFQPGGYSRSRYVGSSAVLGGVTASGRSPLDIMQECADTEAGQFTVDRYGVPTLFGQLWRWIQNSPIVTFGENATSGEIPYQGDITFEQDPAHLYNDIQVTCDGSDDLTGTNALQEVQDSTSQANYFPQTLQKTVNSQVVQGGLNVANYLLSQFKDPHTRLSGLSVDCAGNPSALTALMGLNFADLVLVNRRPTSAPMKSVACFVERVSWSGDDTGKSLAASFQMSPASQYKFGIISATWGQLTAGIAAGVSTITVGPLNGLNLMAAQNVIPANYQMTLGFGTANAETVTVQSVQTVSPGYTSVQITLASPTTNAHGINEYLCDIEPNGITIPPLGTYPTCFDNSSLTGGSQPLIGF